MDETDPESSRQLTVVPAASAPRISARLAASIVVPAIIADAGDRAARRFLEFFAATIRNKNTRMASFGICITSQEHTTVNRLQVLLMILIFCVIGGEMLVPAFLHVNKILMIVSVDAIAFVGLCWAIAIGDQP